jgi:hypothetical protein
MKTIAVLSKPHEGVFRFCRRLRRRLEIFVQSFTSSHIFPKTDSPFIVDARRRFIRLLSVAENTY